MLCCRALTIRPLVALAALIVTSSALACPVELPLDDSFRAPASFADYMTRDVALFMLRGLTDGSQDAVKEEDGRWIVDCSTLADGLADDIGAAVAFDGTVDGRRLRAVFEEHYLTTIETRGQRGWIKDTVEELEAATGFSSWPMRIVPLSFVKRKSRRIYRSPEDFVPPISVSQTLDTDDGDPDAAVLETEVGIKRGEDWDFYSYDRAGNLADFSTFPAGERPSPRICIGCHYDGGSRTVSRLFP